MNKTKITEIDGLTGLLRRKAFLERFRQALQEAKTDQTERPLSLVLMDVDNFKLINDTHGHVTGDDLLVETAKVIRKLAGSGALIGRYGGDEFALIFPDAERDQVFLQMEHIRQALSQQEVKSQSGGALGGISISGGVASFPVDGRTESELLRMADHALYRAKAAGRKQIRLAYAERMVTKTSHYTQTQLERLAKLADARNLNEADLLREAMDELLTKYGVNDIES